VERSEEGLKPFSKMQPILSNTTGRQKTNVLSNVTHRVQLFHGIQQSGEWIERSKWKISKTSKKRH
jgi:hypothetical protein